MKSSIGYGPIIVLIWIILLIWGLCSGDNEVVIKIGFVLVAYTILGGFILLLGWIFSRKDSKKDSKIPLKKDGNSN